MAKLKIGDLKKIKEKVHAETALREGDRRAKITVHMGTCGIASGAREVMNALMQAIEEVNVTDVVVTTSGCMGLCSREAAGHRGNRRPGTDQIRIYGRQ